MGPARIPCRAHALEDGGRSTCQSQHHEDFQRFRRKGIVWEAKFAGFGFVTNVQPPLQEDGLAESVTALAAMPKEKQTLFVGQFRKTKMCRFHETGRCRYGDECPFAHDPSELEECEGSSDPPLLAGVQFRAKNWQQGRCSHASERCPFAHGKEELRKTPPFGRKRSGQGEAFARKDSFEGSDAYASTSEGYRSGSGYFTDIDRQSSSSFDEEPASVELEAVVGTMLGQLIELLEPADMNQVKRHEMDL
eukprot:s1350_g1.t1